LKVLHEKNILNEEFPFEMWIAGSVEYCPHWHEGVEIVYVIDGTADVGLNGEVYALNPRDILIIGGGDVHYYLPEVTTGSLLIVLFKLSLFEPYVSVMDNKKILNPLQRSSCDVDSNHVHKLLEDQILSMKEEYVKKLPGYKMALKARLYDFMVLLIREIPMMDYSTSEKTNQLISIERLGRVHEYVEQNYMRDITIQEVADVAKYSTFYFTRYFKNATGMTFGRFLSSFRVKVAEKYLLEEDLTVTDIAFKCGFNSIKTFNRVFKIIKGCTPTEIRKRNN